MSETARHEARAALGRILAAPTPADLWALQKSLLVIGGASSERARSVARAFHACLRGVASKSASRTASRWGAALGTGAVASVSATELVDRREGALHRLLQSGVPAMLELGAAVKSAEAWEVEARLVYDEFAWFLYDELWEVSTIARPELSPVERRGEIDLLIDPLLDATVPDGDRAALAIDVFGALLAARVMPLLDGPEPEPRATPAG